MNEVMQRRLVGAMVLATALLVFAMIFFKSGHEAGAPSVQPSDLADVRSYAIEVPAVPEQPPQEVLAQGPPIGTLLPGPKNAVRDNGKQVAKSKPAAKPAPKPESAVAPAPVVPDVGWSVQVGSFASRSNADGMLKRLKDMGYSSFIYRNAAENPPLFRVRVGPFTDQDEAKATALRLREALRLDVQVVSNG